MPPVVAVPGESSAAASAPLNYLQDLVQSPGLLAGAGVFSSAIVDLGPLALRVGSFARWRVFVYSDQPGTVQLMQSVDGTNFYPTQSGSYAAGGQAAIFESLVALRYLQAQYTNGATPQGTFVLVLTLVAI